jgi:uncharacterized protein
MKYYQRALNLTALTNKKSHFLLGPRQTGKTFLIRETLPNCKYYNLLASDVFLKLSQAPQRIREELSPEDKVIVIDEIQKLPELLDEVQLLIEEKGIHFLLTGSSARKLKQHGINMLGGRARIKHMHPLTCREIGQDFDLLHALDVGLIPSIYQSDEPYEDLIAYVGNYLKEEVAAEAAVRSIPAFSRFLTIAGLSNGQLINYTKIASDAQVARTTVHEYFQILRDTLLAYDLPPWGKSIKRKPVSTSKYYLFDVGVARFLQGKQGLQPGSPDFGDAFEAFIHHELQCYCDYKGKGPLNFWRSSNGDEVDFILADKTAIEVKGKRQVPDRDFKSLHVLKEEDLLKNYILVCDEDTPRMKAGLTVFPWQDFLQRLWNDEFV